MNELKRTVMAKMNMEVLDQETNLDVERMVILRIATKHINLWIRQLEMKRKEIAELAVLLKCDEIKKDCK